MNINLMDINWGTLNITCKLCGTLLSNSVVTDSVDVKALAVEEFKRVNRKPIKRSTSLSKIVSAESNIAYTESLKILEGEDEVDFDFDFDEDGVCEVESIPLLEIKPYVDNSNIADIKKSSRLTSDFEDKLGIIGEPVKNTIGLTETHTETEVDSKGIVPEYFTVEDFESRVSVEQIKRQEVEVADDDEEDEYEYNEDDFDYEEEDDFEEVSLEEEEDYEYNEDDFDYEEEDDFEEVNPKVEEDNFEEVSLEEEEDYEYNEDDFDYEEEDDFEEVNPKVEEDEDFESLFENYESEDKVFEEENVLKEPAREYIVEDFETGVEIKQGVSETELDTLDDFEGDFEERNKAREQEYIRKKEQEREECRLQREQEREKLKQEQEKHRQEQEREKLKQEQEREKLKQEQEKLKQEQEREKLKQEQEREKLKQEQEKLKQEQEREKLKQEQEKLKQEQEREKLKLETSTSGFESFAKKAAAKVKGEDFKVPEIRLKPPKECTPVKEEKKYSSLIEYLKDFPNAELNEVYRYFTKKDVQRQLLANRIIKRGNRLNLI